VQPYGADLYVGWTMWRSRSTATLLAHFLRDTFGRFAPLPVFSAELRAASTRAMRESVHSLAREGVAAAAHVDEARARQEAAASERAGSDEARYDEARYDEARYDEGRRANDRDLGDQQDPSAGPRSPASGALPRATPTTDPTAGWASDDRARERVTRSTGWGPPPRD
jgi:hypothetical protein